MYPREFPQPLPDADQVGARAVLAAQLDNGRAAGKRRRGHLHVGPSVGQRAIRQDMQPQPIPDIVADSWRMCVLGGGPCRNGWLFMQLPHGRSTDVSAARASTCVSIRWVRVIQSAYACQPATESVP